MTNDFAPRYNFAVLLSVQDLVTSFRTDAGPLRAVDGVSFDVPEGATVGLVGESGCGKSVTALSLLRLVPQPPGSIDGGRILFRGKDLLALPERAMRDLRGNEISMIFQEPMTSLNPVYTVGAQIVEAIRLHQKASRRDAYGRAVELLRLVGIASAETSVDAYPHQLSGGQRQRVMIAMALACQPKLLIADEPTTALDVTIQAQILELLRGLQKQMGMSVILITHDLGVVAEYTDHVVVMYAGKVVESAPARALFAHPRHPYTRGLLQSVPRFGSRRAPGKPAARLPTIEGLVPDLRRLPPGCRFADRCPMRIDACTEAEPELVPAGESLSRCIRAHEVPPPAQENVP
jgi:peptide/nickel transport system ATP-binding protein